MTRSKTLIKGSTDNQLPSRIPWQQAFTLTSRLAVCICLLTASVQLHHYWQSFGWSVLPSLGQYAIIAFLFLLAWLVEGGRLALITAFALLATLSF